MLRRLLQALQIARLPLLPPQSVILMDVEDPTQVEAGSEGGVERIHWAIYVLSAAFLAVLGLLIYSRASPQAWLVALLLFGVGYYRAYRLLR
jgi:hypothetical protein